MRSSSPAQPPPPYLRPSLQLTGAVPADVVTNQFGDFSDSFTESSSSSTSTSTSDSLEWYSSSSGDSSNSNSVSSSAGADTSYDTSASSSSSQPSRSAAETMGGPLDMTLPQLLKHWADHRADHPALIFRHPNDDDVRTVFTYKDLYTLGGRCAAMMRSRGVRREDVVIVLLPNSPERAVIEAAALLLGAFTVSASCKEADASDLVVLAKRFYATAIVLDPDLHSQTCGALREVCELYDPLRGLVTSVRMPDLRVVLKVKREEHANENDFLCYLKEICSKEYSVNPVPYPHHPCVVLRTAGREDRPPKFVVHTHKNIVAFSKIFMPRTDSPRPMCFLNHPFGTVRGHIAVSLCNPITRILLDERAGSPECLPTAIYKALTVEQCHIAVLSPSVVHDVAAMFEKNPENTFWLYFVGFIGEEVNSEVLTSTLKFSHMVVLSYVSAELLVAAMTVVKDPVDKGGGQVLKPGVFITVTDEAGNVLPSEEVGHLLIKSPLMFKRYLNDPKGTADSFTTDGFFKTGDIGRVENDHLFINPKA